MCLAEHLSGVVQARMTYVSLVGCPTYLNETGASSMYECYYSDFCCSVDLATLNEIVCIYLLEIWHCVDGLPKHLHSV